MSFLDYLFCLFIEPLKLLFEVVFFYAYKFTGNVGISIVVISLVINILVLPLYKRADKLSAGRAEDFMLPIKSRPLSRATSAS